MFSWIKTFCKVFINFIKVRCFDCNDFEFSDFVLYKGKVMMVMEPGAIVKARSILDTNSKQYIFFFPTKALCRISPIKAAKLITEDKPIQYGMVTILIKLEEVLKDVPLNASIAVIGAIRKIFTEYSMKGMP